MFFDRPEAGRKAVLLHVYLKSLHISAAAKSAAAKSAAAKSAAAKSAAAKSAAAKSDPPANDVNALAECAELARTASVDVVDTITASRDQPHPRWFVGSGKLEELRERLEATGADLLIVNHDLGAGQQRNLESDLGCRVLTRTELILTIFANRARTYEGKLQVELAQLKHAQTRLIRGWTHLDRQKGGIGLRGAGEKQLELDQRMLTDRIKAAERKLKHVASRRELSRRRRDRSNTPTISLVGYTNAGKSTLFNAVTRGEVLVEDKLFATLDPTLRQLKIDGIGHAVLIDTVGFINHLPHSLIEAFKATLEEVSRADMLLHIVDASAVDFETRIQEVNAVLEEIGALDIPTIMVFNKVDLAQGRATALVPGTGSAVRVSAMTGEGLDDLLTEIADNLGISAPTEVLLEPGDGRTRAWLYRLGAVIEETHQEDGRVALTLRADAGLLARLESEPTVLLQHGYPIHKLPTLANRGSLPRTRQDP